MYDPQRGYPKVVPYLVYEDPRAAAEWLERVLGFARSVEFSMADGRLGHVELVLDRYVLMLGMKSERFGAVASVTQVFVDDVDATCEWAVLAGGAVVEPAVDEPWGLRQALVADPEGQRWEITKHQRDVDVAEWGGEIVGPIAG